jgi:hypothetical protein
LLAAFVDGELRGVATPIQVLDTWMYFLTVYANTTGEVVSFQAYVAAADVVAKVEGSINFQANQIYGEPDNPVILQAMVPEDAFTDVDEFETESLPQAFILYPNYPNPFNATTRLEYQVAVAGKVEIAVYNLMGQPVRVLVDGIQAMGRQTIDWDGLDSAGEQVPGGVYIYRMQAGEFAALRKMTVLK